MSTLSTIHAVSGTTAVVDAGVLWRDVIRTSLSLGSVPPQLTDYTNLSVGGTLSVGGVSGRYQQGAQIDHVRELEVVTGTGDLVRCSAERNPGLFAAALGGLGQCGIITKAVIELVPAPTLVRLHTIPYTDNAQFFRDMRTLLSRGELHEIYNMWVPTDSGWSYVLHAVAPHGPDRAPDTSHLLRGLSVAPSSATVQDIPLLAYLERVNQAIDAHPGYPSLVKPWFDVWLPDRTVEQYIARTLPQLTPDDVGGTGFLLLFPQRRAALRRPFFRAPASDTWVYLFDILTSSATPEPPADFALRMAERNRRLYEDAVDVGATRYPIGTLDFDRADWRRHYGARWDEFANLKRRFDPEGILTPGPGIFS